MLLFISKIVCKNILSPAVLIGLPWIFALILLIPSNFDYDVNSIYFLYFAIGIFVFDIGYLITASKKIRNYKEKSVAPDMYINNKLIKLIIIFEVIVMTGYGISLLRYIKSNYLFNIFYTLKSGSADGTLQGSGFISYFIVFIIAFTSYTLIAFMKAKNFKKKEVLITLQIIIGAISAFLTLGRTAILLYVILNLTTFLIYSNVNNKVILKYTIISGVCGVVLFSIYNLAKYPYLLDSKSPMEVSLEMLSIYTSGSMIAFQKWATSNIELLYGGNLLRFLAALLESVGYDLSVPQLVNPFIDIGGNTTSNVYTFYYFYAADFGLIYALIIQFIVGMAHGVVYKKMTFKQPFWVYVFSLSLYPLLMQFFQDQYFSLTSSWIQYIFYGIVFFKTKIFLQYTDINKLETNNINLF
jgi:oligosaccharide repeat unit polymerase